MRRLPAQAPATVLLLAVLAGCADSGVGVVTEWRIRTDDTVELNEDAGWAASTREAAVVPVDAVFRVRFEVEHADSGAARLRLEGRRNGGAWVALEALDHPYPDEIASPITSIVSSDVWSHGEPTEDLLGPGDIPFSGGSGISLRPSPLLRTLPAGSTEWEWPLVIRYFSDGATRVGEGDTFEYRLTDWSGTPLDGPTARVTATVPEGHLGGTFVETPGRIGPFQAASGDLYFIQEPSETYNVFMIVKSEDGGRTWVEADGANRPPNGDLEAVSAVRVDDVIHIIHLSDETWYYRFNTSDHASAPDSWAERDFTLAPDRDPPTQVTALAARSDGSLVAIYGGDVKLHYRIRSAAGEWGEEATIDAATPDTLSGPVVVTAEDDAIHLAYVNLAGNGWVRRILPDGSLTTRTRFAAGLGTREVDRVAILPLVRLGSGAVSIVYRPEDGRLLERRLSPTGALGRPTVVTSVRVASGPVDSDQVTADAIGVGDDVHALFVEEATGSLWHVVRPAGEPWGTPRPVMDGIEGQWVRGARVEGRDGESAYGFVVDTGSWGGSGMNRYGEVPIR
ncbi:MAG TPA: sialidase family protein [Longimicrobiales bacterium]|nr:sialidase family protein [Longimicrobiales bacterium]